MNRSEQDALRDLMRRVEEVRGLEPGAGPSVPAESVTTDDLLDTLQELAAELERSHRRLIETNVQLVSLREVASNLLATHEVEDTTQVVTRYLCRAFGFDDGFLLLVNRETLRLEGTWTHIAEGRERSISVSVPLTGDSGAVTRALWLNRTLVHHTPAPGVTAALPEGHPLADTLDGLSGVVCVPLQRNHSVLPDGESHELCGAHCITGDIAVLAPPPDVDPESWEADREERQRHCLSCDIHPALGVIGMARRRGVSLTGSDVSQLESIALSVAPVVENARLTHELRRSERFRQHVLDSMGSALVAVNMSGEILTFNRAAEELLGVQEADVLGQPFGARFGPDGELLLRDALENGREAQRVETMLRTHEGSAVPVRLTTSLLRDERRAVYGAIATFMDLTALKRAEEHAQRLDRLAALGRFTSSVAHEIRNPITGISAGIQYLSGSLEGDAEQRENMDFILREMKRLDRIVQDLFDVTHPRQLELRPTSVEEAVRFAAQCLDAQRAQRGVALEVDVAAGAPPVPHDGEQLQQVLINLLKNALEASPQGATLRVSVAPWWSRGKLSGTEIQVRDQGPGIAPEHLRTIFEPFFTTKPGGSGLGLYISHDIVKRHGGSLSVSSDSGRGTTFTVELPADGQGGSR
jgi:PAS domain S-box-containing protein